MHSDWSPTDAIKTYAPTLLRKMGLVAVGWVIMYFVTQPFRAEGNDKSGLNILMLFAPMVGALAGLVAGWYLATDAVEDSNLNGLILWVILVLGATLPMWLVEGLFHLILKWPMNFGGFMVLTSATLLALASAVWLASTQE